MAARHPQTAVYDEYLEAKMRRVLEALVEALLAQRPEDVDGFCIDWLQRWHRDHDSDEEELARLRAQRDLLRARRDGLLTQLSNPGAPAPAFRPESALSRGSDTPTRGAPDRSDGAEEDLPVMRSQSLAAEEALEQEKIRKLKGKDRRAGVSAQAISAERLKDWKAPCHKKPGEVRDRIKRQIEQSDKLQVLFGHLQDKAVYGVVDAMFSREVRARENVITQGEEGDNFYIVDEGTFEAFVARGDGPAAKVCEYGPGGMFGELALMYNARRAATVTATSDAKLWALDRESFQMMLTTAENTQKKKYEEFLEKVEILQDLTKYERAQLSDMLESDIFDAGETIINQGDAGSCFYIIEDGEAKAYIGGEHGEIEVKHYHEGEYFGEIALLKSATRKATVRASGSGCTVLSVNRNDFDLVLGPIKDILGKNMGKYPQYADFVREENEMEELEKAEQEKIDHMKDGNRRAGVSAPAISADRMKEWKAPKHDKSPQTREKIKQIVANNDKLQVLFGHLTEASLMSVIDAMFPQSVEAGANLITQGEQGDNFYIIDEGTFDVYVQRGNNPPGKVCEYGPGAMFGELALMYNAPRAATVRATSRARLWALDRESFQMMLCTAENIKKSRYEEFLAAIEIFQHMTKYELARLSDMLETELYEAGDDIVKQGEEGDYFFILEDGEAKAYINGERGEIEVRHYTTPGEFFGEVALITKDTRRATVRAFGDCSLLSVSRDDFDRVIGPIKDALEANIDKYPNYADAIRKGR